MTSTSNFFGLSLFDNIGGKFKGQSNVYPLVVTNISLGNSDPLSPANAGGATGSGVGPYVAPVGTTAGATTQIAGVFQSVTYVNEQGQNVVANYWPANTALFAGTIPYVNVNDDPYCEFKIQCNGALPNGGSVIHKNYNCTVPGTTVGALANPISGISQVSLNVNTYVAPPNNTYLSLRVTGLAPASIQSNAWNDSFPVVKVIINNHAYRAPQPGL